MKQQAIYKIIGMQKDVADSGMDKQHAFDLHNLRTRNSDTNTLTALVNEIGNLRAVPKTELDIKGTVIGFSILNDQGILFTHELPSASVQRAASIVNGVICDYEEELSTKTCDHIYIVTVEKREHELIDGNDVYVDALEYFCGNLGFSTDNPIECTTYFENEKVQKVYWVDGLHGLRYANIADRNGDNPWTDNMMFDSVPLLHLQEDVTVQRNSTGGVFPSGTVQWCFTYLDRYGAESNIAWISPVHYSSPDDRGGAPDETCSNSFTLTITKYEPKGRFDYIRLYHIIHTSLDTQVDVRRVADIAVPDGSDGYTDIIYTDTNTTGESVDPNELLFLDKLTSIIPNTIEQKSNTLFLGNLEQKFKNIREALAINQGYAIPWGTNRVTFELDNNSPVLSGERSGYYSHQNQLQYSSWDITSFKCGEVYRFGFQAQDRTGRWSDVWWLCDGKSTKHPTYVNGHLESVNATFTLDSQAVTKLKTAGFVKVRPVVVYPEPWERNIFTEGLLNPTVYNVKDRASNAPFAQSSWFIRPFPPIDISSLTGTDIFGNMDNMVLPETGDYVEMLKWDGDWYDELSYLAIDSPFRMEDATVEVWPGYPITMSQIKMYDFSQYGSWAEYRHNHPLGDSQQRNGEIQSMYNPRLVPATQVAAADKYTLFATSYKLNLPYVADNTFESRREFVNTWADFFYVDQSILTMNSADVQFDEAMQARSVGGYSLRIVGMVPISSFISSYDVQVKTPQNKFFSEDNDSLTMPQGLYSSEIVGATMEASGHGWKSLISGSYWHDDVAYSTFTDSNSQDYRYNNNETTPVGFAVYPWQGTGSMNNDNVGSRRVYPKDNDMGDKESKSNTGDNYISAELKYKTLSNLHYSYRTHYLNSLSDAKTIGARIGMAIDLQKISLTKLSAPLNSDDGSIHYFSHVDKLITPVTSASFMNTVSSDYDDYKYRLRLSRKGGYPIMVSSLPYLVHNFNEDAPGHIAFSSPYTPMGYPNVLFAPEYFSNSTAFEESEGHNGWIPADIKDGADRSMAAIPIKYSSCNHLVLALDYTDDGNVYQRVLDWYGNDVFANFTGANSIGTPFWNPSNDGFESVEFLNDNVQLGSAFEGVTYQGIEQNHSYRSIKFDNEYAGYLYMGQLFRDDADVQNRFGGTSDEALEQNIWLPAGPAQYLSDGSVTLIWKAGDTYYQRYDALRTYPYTEEDVNKVVDIVSFMTETTTNIDGRCDRNRGLSNNNHCRPQNFNKINYVYSQRDNFFTYQARNPKKVNLDVFEYSFTWSLTKVAGALRDEWTRLTLASTYDCDGNKGPLNKIVRLDNSLVAFQSGGVAQILFNENVQLQSSEGMPIELANSGRLQGLRYYTTEVGCQNKWNIAVFPNGIYWVDGRTKEFCSLSNAINQVSTIKLMSTWFKNRKDLSTVWNPGSWNGFVSLRDITSNELFLTSKDTCLCYDTTTEEFVGFFDYQKTNAMFAIDGCVITAAQPHIPHEGEDDVLWLHRKSKQHYCRFYDKDYPFWIEIICNSNNQTSDYGLSKIFDNMNWRSDAWAWGSDSDQNPTEGYWQYKPFTTFSNLSGFNDYQKFNLDFTNDMSDSGQGSHPPMPLNLRKKFKVWYTTMPRAEGTPRDRIRDTWCHIKLTADTSVSNYKHIIHDLAVTYFIP